MKKDEFELALETLFVQPAVPESLEPGEVLQVLEKPRPPRRPAVKVINIAAAVALVSVLAFAGGYALHRSRLPDASLLDEDETVLTQQEEDPLVMQADLVSGGMAEKTVSEADQPSEKPGCLPGCTAGHCQPDCPNYDGEEA